jgi:hypothetical protein
VGKQIERIDTVDGVGPSYLDLTWIKGGGPAFVP